jgi:hypothetical protein
VLLALASAGFLRSECLGTRDRILLSQIRDLLRLYTLQYFACGGLTDAVLIMYARSHFLMTKMDDRLRIFYSSYALHIRPSALFKFEINFYMYESFIFFTDSLNGEGAGIAQSV